MSNDDVTPGPVDLDPDLPEGFDPDELGDDGRPGDDELDEGDDEGGQR